MPRKKGLVGLAAALLVAGVAVALRSQPPGLRQGDLRVRSLDAGSHPAGDGKGLVLTGGRPAALEVGSEVLLSSVRLTVDLDGPADLAVAGGEVGERILRPDGSVEFEIRVPPRKPDVLGFLPGRPRYRYPLTVERPGAPVDPITVTLRGEP